MPINDQAVGRIASLVDIAVCEVSLIRIPSALAGWEYRPGHVLDEGWVHGSAAVDGSLETHGLDHRSRDDNARRHVGYFALHDWLFGGDDQWLTVATDNDRYYSHDHGHYFPAGPNWSIADLDRTRDDPNQPPWLADGLDSVEIERVATGLDGVDSGAVEGALSIIPQDWPISDDELAALVDWTVHRASSVARRLRAHSAP